jgi:hypothetical protein
MENEYLTLIRVWAALAWADGRIAKEEALAITRFIDGSAELSDDEKRSARSFLYKKVELDTTNIIHLNAKARRGIFNAAVRLSKLDKQVAAAEVTFLKHLRQALALDDSADEDLPESGAVDDK